MTEFKSTKPTHTEKSQRGPRDDRGVLADQILTAARTLFATHSYAATSLRMVAEKAGVDQALVSYYFHNKRGLLDAVLTPPEGFLAGIAAAAAAPLPTRGIALLQAHLRMWDHPQSAEILQAIIQTAAHELLAMNRLRDIFATHILPVVAEHLPVEERQLRASLIASQIVGLAMTRYIWKVGPIATITSSQVVDFIAPTMQHYLLEPL